MSDKVSEGMSQTGREAHAEQPSAERGMGDTRERERETGGEPSYESHHATDSQAREEMKHMAEGAAHPDRPASER